MNDLNGGTFCGNELERKHTDADSLIHDVIKKVPEERKAELLGVINGFVLGVGCEKLAQHIDNT